MISCCCSIDKPSSQERCPGQEDGTLAHGVHSSTHPTNSEIWYVNWIIYDNLTQTVSHKLFMTETRHTDPSHVGGQDCCEATCESWTCSDGLAPNPDKDCNMQSFGGEVNSSTWLILLYLILFDDVWCTSSRRNAMRLDGLFEVFTDLRLFAWQKMSSLLGESFRR